MRLFNTPQQVGIFAGKSQGMQTQGGIFSAQSLRHLGQLVDFFGKLVEIRNHPTTIVVQTNFRQ